MDGDFDLGEVFYFSRAYGSVALKALRVSGLMKIMLSKWKMRRGEDVFWNDYTEVESMADRKEDAMLHRSAQLWS
jgi:hypothetical protein